MWCWLSMPLTGARLEPRRCRPTIPPWKSSPVLMPRSWALAVIPSSAISPGRRKPLGFYVIHWRATSIPMAMSQKPTGFFAKGHLCPESASSPFSSWISKARLPFPRFTSLAKSHHTKTVLKCCASCSSRPVILTAQMSGVRAVSLFGRKGCENNGKNLFNIVGRIAGRKVNAFGQYLVADQRFEHPCNGGTDGLQREVAAQLPGGAHFSQNRVHLLHDFHIGAGNPDHVSFFAHAASFEQHDLFELWIAIQGSEHRFQQ